MKNKIVFFAVALVLLGLSILFAVKACETTPTPSPKPVAVNDGTYIQIFNDYDSSVTVYVTLGATPGCIQSVLSLPFVTDTVPGQKGMQGTFVLAAKDSTAPFSSGALGLNGVISFMYAPDNCPSVNYPNGLNQFEFILNNTFQLGYPQESINISCVHGVNCVIRVDMITDSVFNAGPLFPVINSFANKLDRNAIGMPGVYPYGCDTCTMWKSPPSCIVLPQVPQKEKICQIQRPAANKGGTVKVIYLGQSEILK